MLEGVKLITNRRAAVFPWEEKEPEGLRFQIRSLTQLEEDSLPAFNEEALRRKNAYKFDKRGYSKKFVRLALIGWEGMKWKHVPELMDSKLEPDIDPEKEIVFSEQEKEELIAHMNNEFSDFVARASERAKREGKELEKN